MYFTKNMLALTLLTTSLYFAPATPGIIESKPKTPKLTIVFVIDQFAHHYLHKVKPHLQDGIKHLLANGVVFNNAIFPHGMPSTPTGHAALGTGTYGYIHGITSYGFINQENEYTLITDDTTEKAAVFSSIGVHDYGKSACNLMVDTLCDQFALTDNGENTSYAYAISLKARASIPLAGRKGKAIWFDNSEGTLTSSKAYFDTLPSWLKAFNKKNTVKNGDTFVWKKRFPNEETFYSYAQKSNYKNSALGGPLIDSPFTINMNDELPFNLYDKTPFAHKLLLDAGRKCIKAHLSRWTNNRMLLYISLSSFDFSGHFFGPNSFEQLDMIYHLDQQIGKFMDFAEKIVPKSKILYVLTADHGIMPIPEVLNSKGFSLPVRINVNKLIEEMNEIVNEKYDIPKIVNVFEAPQFYLDKAELGKLSIEKRKNVIKLLQKFIESKPGIRHCWTPEELRRPSGPNDHYRKLFAKQMYKDRGGDLTCFLHPYYMLTKYPTGTSHATPYQYDLHVPLAIYQHDRIGGKTIDKPVSMLQLASTLAHLLDVPAPSAATNALLPGIS